MACQRFRAQHLEQLTPVHFEFTLFQSLNDLLFQAWKVELEECRHAARSKRDHSTICEAAYSSIISSKVAVLSRAGGFSVYCGRASVSSYEN